MSEMIETYEEMKERYENLILQRDRIEKDAGLYQMDYLREFGDEITKAFQLKIDCIALKKSITFCQTRINAGEEIDPISMQEYIDAGMIAYRDQLQDLISMVDAGKSMTPISFLDVEEIKKIYRRIVKKLHPDIFPLTSEDPVLKELFQKAQIAYRANDLKGIREAEVLINRYLKELGVEPMPMQIDDLPEKIADLETEIANMVNTEPYTYRGLLEDPEAVEKKHQELTEEIEYYQNYKQELQIYLESLLTRA